MECDILVIGAGVMGLASAYYMKKRDPSKKILVIDMYGGPAQGNSGKSEGGFRNMFTSKTNYLLADSSIDFFYHCEEEKGYNINLDAIGYLWLFSGEQYETVKPAIEVMEKRGVDLRILEREDIESALPALSTELGDGEEAELMDLKNIDYGVYGSKCGSLDADALVRTYESLFLKLGGEIKYGTKASSLILRADPELGIPGEPFVWQKKVITGARIDKGDISALNTVVACGVWAHTLLEPLGFDSFQRPKTRQIFAFKDPKLEGVMKTRGLNQENVLPLTILPTASIFLKSEPSEGSIWLGCADEVPRSFELEDEPQAEDGYYSNNIYHVLSMYFPDFIDMRPLNAWAGQYAINSVDETPVVYKQHGLLYVGCGSGSGIMKCDSIGRIADALLSGEEEAELFGGRKIRCSDIGVKCRSVEPEEFVI